MHLQFVQSESTFAYFNATQRYLEQHGKPVAFYTDKHAVFRVNKPSGLHGDGMTQFGRALKALSIEIICANSSQAKGQFASACMDRHAVASCIQNALSFLPLPCRKTAPLGYLLIDALVAGTEEQRREG
jgi:hypothetical protein